MSRAEALSVLLDLLRLPSEQRRAVWKALPAAAQRAILDEWFWQAHGGQIEPDAAPDGLPWRVWAIVAGRGFGKTRAGAEWVWARAREQRDARIALVAATYDEVARVMVEGESGLLAAARCDERPRWIASRGLLLFPSGAEGHAFSAECPEKLRGPQHHHAWCDELAKWPGARADATWNNLMLGLRLGARPRTIVTTTPKPVPLLKRILDLDRCVATHGRTGENLHLPADFIEATAAMFAGTRLARQELEGLLLDEHEGALWSRELLEKARGPGDWGLGIGESDDRAPTPNPKSPIPTRTVIGLDPPASTGGASCGIVICAMDEDGIAWVLADLTAHGLSPEAWARRVADAARQYRASRIVAEKNQGGDMIASILRAVDANLPVRLVAATKSKAARAEPIALRFETGRARLAGRFPELEDQLCALTWEGFSRAGEPGPRRCDGVGNDGIVRQGAQRAAGQEAVGGVVGTAPTEPVRRHGTMTDTRLTPASVGRSVSYVADTKLTPPPWREAPWVAGTGTYLPPGQAHAPFRFAKSVTVDLFAKGVWPEM